MTDTPDVTSYSDPEHIASAHESGMTFESAMEAVRNGHAVRREHWGGFSVSRCLFEIIYRGEKHVVRHYANFLTFRSCILEQEIGRYNASEEDRSATDWQITEHPNLWREEGTTFKRARSCLDETHESQYLARRSWDGEALIYYIRHPTYKFIGVKISFSDKESTIEPYQPSEADSSAEDWLLFYDIMDTPLFKGLSKQGVPL